MTAAVQSYLAISNDPSSSQAFKMQPQSTNIEDGSIAVVAPCDLDEGYTFLVKTTTTNDDGLYHDTIPVTVPSGGVRQGQIFYTTSRPSHLLHTSSNQSLYSNSSSTVLKVQSMSSYLSEWTPLVQQPYFDDEEIGKWKDRWYDCFRYGLFHVSVWNACCCPQILAAQVFSRLQLSWCGDPTPNDNTILLNHRQNKINRPLPQHISQLSFYRVFVLVMSYWTLTAVTDPNHLPGPTSLILNMLILLLSSLSSNNDTNNGIVQQHYDATIAAGSIYTIYNAINLMFGLYTIIVIAKLRFHTRRKYQIMSPTKVTLCSSCGNKEIEKFSGSTDTVSITIGTSDNQFKDYMLFDDCCMALCCTCCTVAQIARQTASYYYDPHDSCSTCIDDHDSDSNINQNRTYDRGTHAVCCSVDGLPQTP